MQIEGLSVGPLGTNCYLLWDEETQEGVIIDPGDEAQRIWNRIDFTPLAVLVTHAHIDHVGGIKDLLGIEPLPFYMHPDGKILYDALPEQAAWMGILVSRFPQPTHELSEGLLELSSHFSLKVLETPGHAPGHVCFVGEDFAIVGDCLFAGSIGRTDLPGGDYDLLMRSIRDKLLTLPDEMKIYPGHGPPTTIGQERRTNPFLIGFA